MSPSINQTEDFSALLSAWCNGDEAAFSYLFPLVLRELKVMAHARLRREPTGHLWQTTALVTETYTRLQDWIPKQALNRSQFLAVAAQVMRHILIEDVRKHPRGQQVGDEMLADSPLPQSLDLVALDDALKVLAKLHPRKNKVVTLRFFGGLDREQIAAALNISPRTVDYDWEFAKAWLYQQLNRQASDLPQPRSSQSRSRK